VKYGDQTALFFEVDQPLCSRTFGTAPCNGHLALGIGVKTKCFNTRATCLDPTNYDPSVTKVIRFCRPELDLTQYDPVIPSMNNLSITPGTINLGGMSKQESPLGQRESVTVTFDDHLHPDSLGLDPYRLERITGIASRKALVLDGSNNCYATTPDSAAADITADIEFRAHVKCSNWLPASIAYIIAKDDGTGAAGAYYFAVTTTGALRIATSDGVTLRANDSTVLLSDLFSNGDEIWLRGTLDLDNGAGSRVANFYYSYDYNPVDGTGTWVQLGATVTTAVVVTIQNNALSASVGAASTGITRKFTGSIYYAEARSPLGGAIKISFDPNAAVSAVADGAASFVSPTGETWTLNGTAHLTADVMYDPYTSGSFWGKWLARNPYYTSYNARVRWGVVGDDADDMDTYNYVLNRVEGPNEGVVSVTAKDLFSLIEAKKAVAPTANSGYLSANIAIGALAATLAPAGIGNSEYPASGYLRIGDEIVSFTRAADVLTIVRAQLGTTAAAHEQEDAVQLVLYYNAQLVKDILYDLLINYGGGITPGMIDLASTWAAASIKLNALYTGVIEEPTPIADLVGELAEIAGFTLWPDVRTSKLILTALRASSSGITVNDDAWLVDKSFSLRQLTERRVSQLWVYYGRKDPTKAVDEKKNYRSCYIGIDLNAESTQQYGLPAIREVFGRWIPQFGRNQAQDTSDRLLTMFRDPPWEAKGKLHGSRSGSLSLAAPFDLQALELQEPTGQPATVQHMCTSLGITDDEIQIRSQSVVFPNVEASTSEITIYIDSNARNVNLRSVYNSLYATISATVVVNFVVSPGVLIGSATPSSPSMLSGGWPAAATVRLVNYGRIQGAGGLPGAGGDYVSALNGYNGGVGGTALKVTRALSVNNQGYIWSGGGGGGGGAATANDADVDGHVDDTGGGGGGGGGAGDVVAPGAAGGATDFPGSSGSISTLDAPGDGGLGGGNSCRAGDGGDGGLPGEDGKDGDAPLVPGNAGTGVPGLGASKGNYVEGNAFVTWVTIGDRRGNVT
jgi:hypothetical protein